MHAVLGWQPTEATQIPTTSWLEVNCLLNLDGCVCAENHDKANVIEHVENYVQERQQPSQGRAFRIMTSWF